MSGQYADLKQKAYEIIKKKIITCEMMPGDLIDQNALKDAVGTSRTPVREAIHSLEQEGLVTVVPRRGVFVSNISFVDINDIYTVREAVEPLIARLATPFAEKEKLEELHGIFQQEVKDFRVMTNSDYMLHGYLAEKTGNRYLIRLMDSILSQNMRIVVLGAKIPERLQKSNEEHRKIIEKMLERDPEGAEEAMRLHIENAKMIAAMVDRISSRR